VAVPRSSTERGDRNFVENAGKRGLAGVELGRLAAERGASDAVKRFGQRIEAEPGRRRRLGARGPRGEQRREPGGGEREGEAGERVGSPLRARPSAAQLPGGSRRGAAPPSKV